MIFNIFDTLARSSIFVWVDAILYFIFLLTTVYLLGFATFSLLKKPRPYPSAGKKYKFAIIFYATDNDEMVLENISFFLGQQYPIEKYRIFLPDNFLKPSTLEALSSKKVQTFSLPSKRRLDRLSTVRTALKYINSTNDSYDIIILLDPSNIVDCNFLELINNAFYAGCSVAQTHLVAQSDQKIVQKIEAISQEINNTIFRKGHIALGFSSALNRSGMAFENEILQSYIFKSGNNRLEKLLETKLLKENYYIEYLDNVFTYDNKINKQSEFYEQRGNWIIDYVKDFFNSIFNLPIALFSSNSDYINKLIQWILPPKIILLIILITLSIIITFINWIIAIKWWGLLFLFFLCINIAIPDYLVDKKFMKLVILSPFILLAMVPSTLFKMIFKRKY